MDIPLIIDSDGDTPLYQQLKYQFIYLIGSRQLVDGQKLPSIREIAESLQINIGTVGQAYRELQAEGLIHSARGRGTFVRTTPPPQFAAEASARQDALNSGLNDALTRAVSLGYTAGEIQQRIASMLNSHSWQCHLVFVGTTLEIARKHAQTLSNAFGVADVVVHALDLARLQRGEGEEELAAAHYVVTFLPLANAVREAVGKRPGEHRILTVATKVSDYTIGALSSLQASTRACLVVESRNRHSALNLVASHSQLPGTLPTADPKDPQGVEERCREADVVIHTFSSIDVLDAIGVPEYMRLELRFDTDPESLTNVTRLVRPLAPTSRHRPADAVAAVVGDE